LITALSIVMMIYLFLYILVLQNTLKRVSFIEAITYSLLFIFILMLSSTAITQQILNKLITIPSVTKLLYYVVNFLPLQYIILIINILIIALLYNLLGFVYDVAIPRVAVPVTVKSSEESEDDIEKVIVTGKKKRPSRVSSLHKVRQKHIHEKGSGGAVSIVGRMVSELTQPAQNKEMMDEGGEIVVTNNGEVVFVGGDYGAESEVERPVVDTYGEDVLSRIKNIGDIGEIKIKSKRDIILIALRELARFILMEGMSSDPAYVNDPKNYKVLSKVKVLKDKHGNKKGWVVEIGFKISPLEYYVFKVYVPVGGGRAKIRPVEVRQIV